MRARLLKNWPKIRFVSLEHPVEAVSSLNIFLSVCRVVEHYLLFMPIHDLCFLLIHNCLDSKIVFIPDLVIQGFNLLHKEKSCFIGTNAVSKQLCISHTVFRSLWFFHFSKGFQALLSKCNQIQSFF